MHLFLHKNDSSVQRNNLLEKTSGYFVEFGYLCIYLMQPMETVIREPGESSGLTVLMCKFGSGVSKALGFSVYTRYVLLILSL